MNFYLLHAIKNMPQPLTKPAVTLAATAFCICTFTASGPMAHLWVLRPLQQAHGGGLEPTAPPSERAPSTWPPAPSPSRLGLGGISWPHLSTGRPSSHALAYHPASCSGRRLIAL